MNEEKWRSNQREVLNGGWCGIRPEQIRLFCLAEIKTINGCRFSWGQWFHMVTIITISCPEKNKQWWDSLLMWSWSLWDSLETTFWPSFYRHLNQSEWDSLTVFVPCDTDTAMNFSLKTITTSLPPLHRDRRWHMSIHWWQTEASLFIQPKLIKQSLGFLISFSLRRLVAVHLKQHKPRLMKT